MERQFGGEATAPRGIGLGRPTHDLAERSNTPSRGSIRRDRLVGLSAAVRLATELTDAGSELQIMELASRSASSLGARIEGPYFMRHAADASARPSGVSDEIATEADWEWQLGALGSKGGALTTSEGGWGWAFPLRSLDGHLGFLLMLADETPSIDEHLLLTLLAQQTALALVSVRSQLRVRNLTADLRTADTLFQQHVAIHDRLTDVAFGTDGQDGIAAVLSDSTGLPVGIYDREGNLLSWAGPGRPDQYPDQMASQTRTSIEGVLAGRGTVRWQDCLAIAIEERGDVAAVLALIDPLGHAGDEERIALECSAMALAAELARVQSSVESEQRLSGDLVEELLARTDDQQATVRAQLLGHDLGRPHRVLVIRCEEEKTGQDGMYQAVRRAARDLGMDALLASRLDSVILIAEGDQPWANLQVAIDGHMRKRRCRVGVGTLCLAAEDYPRSYRHAQDALRMQRALPGEQRTTVFDELGVFQLFAEIEQPSTLQAFIRHWLGSLILYDEAKGADLVTTLCEYLEAGGNYDLTAEALILHRSTLRYRLRRIREISGLDLNDPDTRFNLQLATRALRTLATLGEDSTRHELGVGESGAEADPPPDPQDSGPPRLARAARPKRSRSSASLASDPRSRKRQTAAACPRVDRDPTAPAGRTDAPRTRDP